MNNAGFGASGPIEQVTLETAKALFETNYFGAVRMMRAVVPGMRERRRGAIVNVTLVYGLLTMAAHGHYTATKYALEAASESLAAEMTPFGVRVAIIEPGGADRHLGQGRRAGRSRKSLLRADAAPRPLLQGPASGSDPAGDCCEFDRTCRRDGFAAPPLSRGRRYVCLEGRRKIEVEQWIGWQAEAADETFEAEAQEDLRRGRDCQPAPKMPAQKGAAK